MARRHAVRATAACLAGIGLVLVAVGSPAASEEPETFIEGSGTARAQLARFAPRTGGLTYAVGSGVALAGYEGTIGKAQAQTVDLGLFGVILTTVGPCGGEPVLRPDQVPRPVRAHSGSGPPKAEHTYIGDGGAGLGSESATAGPGTESSAESRATTMGVPGVVSVGGGVSSAASRLVAGSARQATAGVSIGTVALAGGLVELRGLRWEVIQHTGAAPLTQGSFHIGQVLVGGQPLPVSGDPAQALVQLKAVLTPTGIGLEPPTVVEHQNGEVEVTPLKISVGGKTQASEPLGGLLANAQPARDVLGRIGEGDPNDCRDPRASGIGPLANAAVLLADISLAGFTGTGGMDVELGGVKAATEGVAYDSPFGAGRPLPAPVLRPVPVPRPAPPAVEEDTEIVITEPARRPILSGFPTDEAAAEVAAPPADSAPVPAASVAQRRETGCASTHPFRQSGCSRGSGLAVGLASLGVATALFAGDALVSRRRASHIKNGVPA